MIIFFIVTTVVLLICCVVLSAVALKTLSRLREYDNFFEELEDQIEHSLTILKRSVEEINSSMSNPIMFDDPIVHKIVRAIQKSHSAVSLVEFELQSFLVDSDENVEELTTKDREMIIDFIEKEEK